MIITDTTEPAAEAATEDDETRTAQRRRERHAALMAALEELTDLAADAGPDTGMGADFLRVEVSGSLYEGAIADRAARLHTIAAALEVEIEERPHDDTVQFWARKKHKSGLDYHVTLIAKTDAEIAEVRAALAALDASQRVTVDYRVEHGSPRIMQRVTAALARFGVDVAASDGFAVEPSVEAIVTASEDRTLVERYDSSYSLPRLRDCASVDAYANAIAMWVKGTAPADIPCPARPTRATRAIRSDGAVLTVYTAPCCYSHHLHELTSDGFAVVDLDDNWEIPLGTDTTCGLRVELAGAR